jgi:hypothetical protein
LDLTFALRARAWVSSECQIRSTKAVPDQFDAQVTLPGLMVRSRTL